MSRSLPLTMTLSLLIGGAISLSGEESHNAEPDTLQLDNQQVWTMARERAPLITAARQEVLAAQAERSVNLSPFRPQLQANMDYRRDGTRDPDRTVPIIPSATPRPFNQTITLPGSPRHQYQGQISLEQSLFTFGRKRAVRQAADAALDIAEQNLLSQRRDSGLRALIALESYRFARATVVVAKARVEQRSGELQDSENLFAAGNVAMLDVRQSRINLATAQDQLRQAEGEVTASRSELRAALALDDDAFSVPDDLRRPENVAALVEEARTQIDGGIDVQRLEANKQLGQAQARAALRGNLPSLGAILAYTAQGTRLNNLEDDWYVGVGAQWSIYDGGGRYAQRRAALAQAHRAEAQQAGIIDERQREITATQAELAALAARIALQKSIVVDSEDNYQDARELYQSGQITLTRVGEVGLAVVEAQFNLNRYRFEESVLAHRLRAFME